MKKSKLTVLVPSLLDNHFPLLQYAFTSKDYDIVMLQNDGKNLQYLGLQYTHNDMCYPLLLIVGQMLDTLQNNSYDLNNTVFLMAQGGDNCRGSNTIHLMRKALKKAGYDVPVISLNFVGLEDGFKFKFDISMIFKSIMAIMYGDLLMLIKNQIEPYELNNGETSRKVQEWHLKLKDVILNTKYLHKDRLKQSFKSIIDDFKSIPCDYSKKTIKVGIVGELYTKYCHIGNWNVEKFLLNQGCEIMSNGFSWYIIYYIDTHLKEGNPLKYGYLFAKMYFESIQDILVNILHDNGFKCLDTYSSFKEKSYKYFDRVCDIGDGWLISAEICNLSLNGYKKILGLQPFGCMANHVCGRGIYSSLQRKLDNTQIVSIDYDASGTEVNVRNRIKMLLDF